MNKESWLQYISHSCPSFGHTHRVRKHILYLYPQGISVVDNMTQVSSHTYSWNSFHGGIAAPTDVSGYNADSVYHIVGKTELCTCYTGGDWNMAWTDSDSVVVNWSPTIILWGLPHQCNSHIVPIILLNSVWGRLK